MIALSHVSDHELNQDYKYSDMRSTQLIKIGFQIQYIEGGSEWLILVSFSRVVPTIGQTRLNHGEVQCVQKQQLKTKKWNFLSDAIIVFKTQHTKRLNKPHYVMNY